MEPNGVQWRLANCEKSLEQFGIRLGTAENLISQQGVLRERLDNQSREIRDMRAETREESKDLRDEMRGVKRAIWAFIASLATGVVVYLVTQVAMQAGGG